MLQCNSINFMSHAENKQTYKVILNFDPRFINIFNLITMDMFAKWATQVKRIRGIKDDDGDDLLIWNEGSLSQDWAACENK